jgi:ubiquinone/menaquinone biosynthesis C-methylase UbiE
MEANLQRRVQRYGWDKAAQHYEDGWKKNLEPAQKSLLGLSKAQTGDIVLDLAAGTGLVSFPLAQQVGESGHVFATDISQNMVKELQREIEAADIKNITAMRVDGEDLSCFEDDSFDLVTCALGLMYFPSPEASLIEIMRVLKPGGRVVFAVWGARSNCGWADIFPIVDARVQSSVCPLFFRLGTRETLMNAVADAGFQDCTNLRLDTHLCHSDTNHVLEAAFIGGPVALAYNRFDAITKDEVHQEYLSSIEKFKDEEGYKIPGEFVVCSAIAPGKSQKPRLLTA